MSQFHSKLSNFFFLFWPKSGPQEWALGSKVSATSSEEKQMGPINFHANTSQNIRQKHSYNSNVKWKNPQIINLPAH